MNKNQMPSLCKHITRQWLDQFSYFLFLCCDNPDQIFKEKKTTKLPGKLENLGKTENAFSYKETNITYRTQFRYMFYLIFSYILLTQKIGKFGKI